MDWTSHISFLGRGLLLRLPLAGKILAVAPCSCNLLPLVGCNGISAMAGIVNPSKDPNVQNKIRIIKIIDSNQVSITLNPKARDSDHSSCHVRVW